MKKTLTILSLVGLMVGCQSAPRIEKAVSQPVIKSPTESASKKPRSSKPAAPRPVAKKKAAPTLQAFLLMAEGKADPSGRHVLATGRNMTLVKREIIKGSCWDYSNEVYNRAGHPNQRNKRKTVFKGTKKRGPYADAGLIKPGDFLYYINHSYGGIEHSAIFVDWIDYGKKKGLMLSYGGERRNEPARYRAYDLSNVYRITRPGAGQ